MDNPNNNDKLVSVDPAEEAKLLDKNTAEIPLKKTITAIIFYLHFGLGLAAYTVGPTLIDLKIIYSTSMDKVSLYFSAAAFGYMSGSLFGFSYRRLNRQLMVGLFGILLGTGLWMIPNGKSLYILYLCGFILCLGGGGLDSAQNVWMMEMWQEKSSPILQMARFAVGLGGIIGPAILKPFITGDIRQSNHTLPNGTVVIHDDDINRAAKLAIPYAINGFICISGGCMMIILFLVKRYQRPEHLDQVDTARPKATITGVSSNAITCLGAIFLAFYGVMEVNIFQFLPTFSHYSPVHFTEQEGDSLLVALSTSNVIAKFFFILIAIKIAPQKILYTNYIIVVVPFVIITYARHSSIALWIATIIFGIGSSAMMATIYAYLEQYLFMTNVKGTMFTMMIGFMGAVVPMLVGSYIDSQPFLLVYVSLVNIIISVVAFIAIHFIVLASSRKRKATQDKEKHDCIN